MTQIVKRKSTRGISALEVLVTAGIVAILCAILVPAIGMAKIGGKATPDMVNLRKLGMAMQVYALDSNEWFPPAVDVKREGEVCAPASTWRQRIAPYLESQTIFKSPMTGLASKACPLGSPVRMLGNYGAQSLWALGEIASEGPRLALSHVQIPYDTLFLGVNTDSDPLVTAAPDKCSKSRVRNGGRLLESSNTPWVFIDGHVSSLTQTEIYEKDCSRWRVIKPSTYFH